MLFFSHRSRKENLHLSSEYNKLQESYKHLESLKLKLETSEVSWKCNLTDAQKDAHNVRQEVRAVSSTTSTASTSTRSSSDLDSGLPLSPPSSNLSLLSPGQISSKETMIASSSFSDHTQVSDVSSFHQGGAGPFSSSIASSGSLRGPVGPPSPPVSSSLLSSQVAKDLVWPLCCLISSSLVLFHSFHFKLFLSCMH